MTEEWKWTIGVDTSQGETGFERLIQIAANVDASLNTVVATLTRFEKVMASIAGSTQSLSGLAGIGETLGAGFGMVDTKLTGVLGRLTQLINVTKEGGTAGTGAWGQGATSMERYAERIAEARVKLEALRAAIREIGQQVPVALQMGVVNTVSGKGTAGAGGAIAGTTIAEMFPDIEAIERARAALLRATDLATPETVGPGGKIQMDMEKLRAINVMLAANSDEVAKYEKALSDAAAIEAQIAELTKQEASAREMAATWAQQAVPQKVSIAGGEIPTTPTTAQAATLEQFFMQKGTTAWTQQFGLGAMTGFEQSLLKTLTIFDQIRAGAGESQTATLDLLNTLQAISEMRFKSTSASVQTLRTRLIESTAAATLLLGQLEKLQALQLKPIIKGAPEMPMPPATTLVEEEMPRSPLDYWVEVAGGAVGTMDTAAEQIIASLAETPEGAEKAANRILKWFEWLKDKLVTNSVIPEMVREINEWLDKIDTSTALERVQALIAEIKAQLAELDTAVPMTVPFSSMKSGVPWTRDMLRQLGSLTEGYGVSATNREELRQIAERSGFGFQPSAVAISRQSGGGEIKALPGLDLSVMAHEITHAIEHTLPETISDRLMSLALDVAAKPVPNPYVQPVGETSFANRLIEAAPGMRNVLAEIIADAGAESFGFYQSRHSYAANADMRYGYQAYGGPSFTALVDEIRKIASVSDVERLPLRIMGSGTDTSVAVQHVLENWLSDVMDTYRTPYVQPRVPLMETMPYWAGQPEVAAKEIGPGKGGYAAIAASVEIAPGITAREVDQLGNSDLSKLVRNINTWLAKLGEEQITAPVARLVDNIAGQLERLGTTLSVPLLSTLASLGQPIDISKWTAGNPLTFWHGTAPENLARVQQQGLLPADWGPSAGEAYMAAEPQRAWSYSTYPEDRLALAGEEVPVEKRVLIRIDMPPDSRSIIDWLMYEKGELNYMLNLEPNIDYAAVDRLISNTTRAATGEYYGGEVTTQERIPPERLTDVSEQYRAAYAAQIAEQQYRGGDYLEIVNGIRVVFDELRRQIALLATTATMVPGAQAMLPAAVPLLPATTQAAQPGFIEGEYQLKGLGAAGDKEFQQIAQGAEKAAGQIVQTFVNLDTTLVGGSLVPDMVREINMWLNSIGGAQALRGIEGIGQAFLTVQRGAQEAMMQIKGGLPGYEQAIAQPVIDVILKQRLGVMGGMMSRASTMLQGAESRQWQEIQFPQGQKAAVPPEFIDEQSVREAMAFREQLASLTSTEDQLRTAAIRVAESMMSQSSVVTSKTQLMQQLREGTISAAEAELKLAQMTGRSTASLGTMTPEMAKINTWLGQLGMKPVVGIENIGQTFLDVQRKMQGLELQQKGKFPGFDPAAAQEMTSSIKFQMDLLQQASVGLQAEMAKVPEQWQRLATPVGPAMVPQEVVSAQATQGAAAHQERLAGLVSTEKELKAASEKVFMSMMEQSKGMTAKTKISEALQEGIISASEAEKMLTEATTRSGRGSDEASGRHRGMLNNLVESSRLVRHIAWIMQGIVVWGAIRQVQELAQQFVTNFGTMETAAARTAFITSQSLDEMIAKQREYVAIGTEYGQVPTEASQFAPTAAKYGMSTPQMAEAAAQLAMISDEQMTMGDATNYLMSIMRQWNIAGDDSARVMDTLVTIYANAPGSMKQLLDLMQEGPALAEQMGQSFEENMLLIGRAMSYLPGRTATTVSGTMGRMLSRVYQEQNARELAATYGITVFEPGTMQRKTGLDVLDQVARKFGEIKTQSEKAALAELVAGTRGQASWRDAYVLLQNWSEGIAGAETKMRSAADMTNEMKDTFQTNVNIMKSTWQGFILALGDTSAIENFIKKLSDIFGMWTKNVQGFSRMEELGLTEKQLLPIYRQERRAQGLPTEGLGSTTWFTEWLTSYLDQLETGMKRGGTRGGAAAAARAQGLDFSEFKAKTSEAASALAEKVKNAGDDFGGKVGGTADKLKEVLDTMIATGWTPGTGITDLSKYSMSEVNKAMQQSRSDTQSMIAAYRTFLQGQGFSGADLERAMANFTNKMMLQLQFFRLPGGAIRLMEGRDLLFYLEKIEENTRTLEGIWNVPEGMRVWVPIESTFYGDWKKKKEEGKGAGDVTLDASAFDQAVGKFGAHVESMTKVPIGDKGPVKLPQWYTEFVNKSPWENLQMPSWWYEGPKWITDLQKMTPWERLQLPEWWTNPELREKPPTKENDPVGTIGAIISAIPLILKESKPVQQVLSPRMEQLFIQLMQFMINPYGQQVEGKSGVSVGKAEVKIPTPLDVSVPQSQISNGVQIGTMSTGMPMGIQSMSIQMTSMAMAAANQIFYLMQIAHNTGKPIVVPVTTPTPITPTVPRGRAGASVGASLLDAFRMSNGTFETPY